jgi:DNA-binding NarL/FixJ family response regulator
VQLSEAKSLNVVIVDDHVALRRGMELLLRRAGHHVVGTADDAESGEALILRRTPDYIDPRLTPLLAKGSGDRTRTLSPREREIMDLLSRGLSGEEAAKQPFLSPETVRTHLRNAMSKLGAATREHAVKLALQRGEIDP